MWKTQAALHSTKDRATGSLLAHLVQPQPQQYRGHRRDHQHRGIAVNSHQDVPALASRAMACVNSERLINMQRQLASFGMRSDGGVSREALTPTEQQARQW